MSLNRCLESFRSALAPRRGRRKPGRRGPLESAMHRLRLEPLEDRRLLSLTPGAILPVDADSYATDVATGDFNNDGRIDVAMATDGDSVSTFLGNGDGTFQPATISATGPSPLSLDVGDFNADGNLDLAVATYDDIGTSDNDVSILLGNGDGTFADAVSLSIPNITPAEGSTSIVTGDLNADGKLDLVVGSHDYSNEEYYSGVLSVLLGDGDGNFTFAATYGPYDSLGLSAPALADFNGDGNADVVVTDWLKGSVEVFLSNGDGTLSAPSSFAAEYGATSVVVGDFNADGKTDLATINGLNGMYDDPAKNVSALLGNGDGTFQTAQSFAAGIEPMEGAAGEFNGDGMLDLVVANAAGGGMSVLLGQGDGSFAPPVTTAAGTYPGSVVVADFNADGRLDAAVAYNDLGVHEALVLLNDGNWPGQNMPQVQIDDVTVIEGNTGTTDAVFTVTLSEPYSDTVTVDYATADGTAGAPGDYVSQSGTLSFDAGVTTQTITVQVNGDLLDETDETFLVELSGAVNATILDGQGTGTIDDDDPVVPPAPLDVDGNGAADALTDGIVILRYLFGFTGGPLVDDALAPDAQRTDPGEMVAWLDDYRDTMLDVDGNGAADALTDGMIVLRYLFGFTGRPLVEEALAPDAQRTDPDQIVTFLDQFTPGVQGTSPLAFAPLGTESVETTSPSNTARRGDAKRVDAVWGDSPRDGGKDQWLAADQAPRASLYRALAYDAVQSRAKIRKGQKTHADEVDLLMLRQ